MAGSRSLTFIFNLFDLGVPRPNHSIAPRPAAALLIRGRYPFPMLNRKGSRSAGEGRHSFPCANPGEKAGITSKKRGFTPVFLISVTWIRTRFTRPLWSPAFWYRPNQVAKFASLRTASAATAYCPPPMGS